MSDVEQWEHDEQRAMENEIISLREQVEKLTEECVVLRASSRTKLDTIAYLETREDENQQKLAALTKERDTEIARNRPLQSLIKSTEETKSFLLKKSEENKEAVKQLDSERQANALLTEELAALAEQNEKLRKVLLRLACLGNGDQYGNSIGNCIAQEALSLPDLASPVLNRIRAEAIIAAANALENIASTSSSTRIRRVANDALTAIRARRK